jgi:predicted tellurium resistance membrane protein TerC
MKLEELIKQRDAYGGKILKLGITIAVIFIVPVLVVLGLSFLTGIEFMYLFPIAFIISWTSVIILYRKISKEVKLLDHQIKKLRAQETNDTSNHVSDNTSL